MRRSAAFAFLAGVLLALPSASWGAGPTSSKGSSKHQFIVFLDQVNDSGLRGKATLTQLGNDVVVVVDLGPQLPEFYKSYIAEGTCDGHIFDFIYDLAPFRGGISKTKIQNASVEALLNDGSYMIAIPNGACGDLANARGR